MTLRALKKREKRAMRELIRKHDMRRDAFDQSDGNESIDAPMDLHPRNIRHGFVHPGLMPGTPVVWSRVSYEYDEWDAILPSTILAEMEFDWEGAMAQLSEKPNDQL